MTNLPLKVEIINNFLKELSGRAYLEIGVRNGQNFFSIECSHKYGVDPEFFFAKRFLLKSLLKPKNWFYKMFKSTSDDFFKNNIKYNFIKQKVGVIFIDGLHTYEQSLKDAINSLKLIDNKGLIIFHDCNPISEIAGSPTNPNREISWNGDVWKTIYHLRKYTDQLDCHTVNTDEGLGVLKWKCGPNIDFLSEIKICDHIKNLPYSFLEKNRNTSLGLQNSIESS
jgi:hypothetical protein